MNFAINCTAFGLLGLVLSSAGATVFTWQFWAALVLAMIIQINAAVRS